MAVREHCIVITYELFVYSILGVIYHCAVLTYPGLEVLEGSFLVLKYSGLCVTEHCVILTCPRLRFREHSVILVYPVSAVGEYCVSIENPGLGVIERYSPNFILNNDNSFFVVFTLQN